MGDVDDDEIVIMMMMIMAVMMVTMIMMTIVMKMTIVTMIMLTMMIMEQEDNQDLEGHHACCQGTSKTFQTHAANVIQTIKTAIPIT